MEPRTPGWDWDAAHAAVTASMAAHDFVVVAHDDALGPDLRAPLFGRALPEFFALPLDVKKQMVSVVVQHDVEGLELQAQDGSWLAVAPEADTVAVVAGELLAVSVGSSTKARSYMADMVGDFCSSCVYVQVVTNGRVPACVHRVSAPRGRERLSAQFVSKPKDGNTVRPLDELVDADHPPLYKPCDFDEYVRFRFAGDGQKLSDPLEAFCGVARGP
ncbi:unnamed protein product [Urochloa decumbens]|uniref:Isopenicillin N synthase-like Fe(2+) 2OG dioxygenase domain-containing protein n=1 Tax=Urochloa decumbens TaxID=240449 RepID=A0ABC9BR40_9POAL